MRVRGRACAILLYSNALEVVYLIQSLESRRFHGSNDISTRFKPALPGPPKSASDVHTLKRSTLAYLIYLVHARCSVLNIKYLAIICIIGSSCTIDKDNICKIATLEA